jgi:hypothetical protein
MIACSWRENGSSDRTFAAGWTSLAAGAMPSPDRQKMEASRLVPLDQQALTCNPARAA